MLRFALTLVAMGLMSGNVLAASGATVVTLEGRKPVACRTYETTVKFLERQAALKATANGYNQFVIKGGLGGTRYYSIVVELLPDGYTAWKGTNVLRADEVLSRPKAC